MEPMGSALADRMRTQTALVSHRGLQELQASLVSSCDLPCPKRVESVGIIVACSQTD